MSGVSVEEFLYQLSVWALPLLLAVGCHEAAHGWAAWKLGDDTARRLGRVTLNPVRHIDPFGTVLLPGLLLLSGAPFLIGYAKPVPVDFSRLQPIRLGMALVAAAGPAANIALCVLSLVVLQVLGWTPDMPGREWLIETARKSVILNAVLAVFNMLPVPPLDGGRILTAVLPGRIGSLLLPFERGGIVLILLVLFVLPWLLSRAGIGFDPLDWLLWRPVAWIIEGLITVI
ncbi:MAG: site-2 protease family protein [Alphaproteobacteria bacterium]|nr:site-2 protease family protein [Alphaproteobacteria bacterium]